MPSRVQKERNIVPFRTKSQLVLFVTDASSSMTETTIGNLSKIDALNQVVRNLFYRLKESRIKQNFDIACIDFAVDARIVLNPVQLITLNPETFSLVTSIRNGGTNLTEALEKAKEMSENYIQTSNVRSSVVIFILSDGEANIRENELPRIASEIKAKGIKIAVCLLPSLDESISSIARNMMKSIASSDELYTEERDIEKIRNFFMRTLTKETNVNL
jgi:Mg-chelatase subunit ChlD